MIYILCNSFIENSDGTYQFDLDREYVLEKKNASFFLAGSFISHRRKFQLFYIYQLNQRKQNGIIMANYELIFCKTNGYHMFYLMTCANLLPYKGCIINTIRFPNRSPPKQIIEFTSDHDLKDGDNAKYHNETSFSKIIMKMTRLTTKTRKIITKGTGLEISTRGCCKQSVAIFLSNLQFYPCIVAS